MTDFYSVLSKYYDALFKSSSAKIEFLMEGLPDGDGTILDVGAATGTFSLPLASKGYRVVAVDYDRQMVAQMAEKALESHLENHISKVGDMRQIEAVSSEGPYDLIYCIGNTLVHLDNETEIVKFLSDCRQMMKSGSRIALQTVNYDRILMALEEQGEFVFPSIKVDKEDLIFKRSYKLAETKDKVLFETYFEDDQQGERLMGQTVLMALKSDDLSRMLEVSGFERIKLYGDFDKRDFVADKSPALIVEAYIK